MVRHVFLALAIIATTALWADPAVAGEETVPDVVGLNVDKARELMEEAGFEATVERVTGKPLGIVFSQEPSGLCTRDTAIPITLRIGAPTPKPGGSADGPPAGNIPGSNAPVSREPGVGRADDSVGAPPAGEAPPAGPAGDPAGMDPASSTPKREPSSNWPNQPSASPQGGFSYKGQPIVEEALQNTNGPALPGVLGQRAGAARQALNRYRVREEQTTAMPELVGQVLNQWPYAGSNLAPGEEVTIVVGVARAPSRMHRGVPQVQSRPWRDAVQMVERSGFQVRLTAMESTDRQRGLIVMQTPLPGSLLESGGTMRLRIGAGSGPYSPGAASGTDRPSSQPVDPRPVDPVPADPRPAERSGGVDTPPAGSANSPIDDGPPAGAGPAPIDTPPSGGRTERPIETPPTRKPASEDPGQDPAPAGGRSFSAPALSTPPAGESYPYKYGADFTWTAVAGASGYEVELQEELPSGAWRSLQTFKVKEARLRPERFERGRYRWRVRGTNGAAKGRWSTYRRLYMY